MKDRMILICYIGVVILITTVHNIVLLLGVGSLIVLLSKRQFFNIAKTTLLAMALFNSIISVSYGVLAWMQGNFSMQYLIIINLRVFILTFSTFLLRERINLFKTFGFSRSLLYLLILAYSQILTMRRVFGEFRLALASRSPASPSLRDRYRHSTATGSFFIAKSLNDATNITQAMRSRGFFID